MLKTVSDRIVLDWYLFFGMSEHFNESTWMIGRVWNTCTRVRNYDKKTPATSTSKQEALSSRTLDLAI